MTEIEEHDLGLSHDLPILISRRGALGLLAGGLGATALAACGSSSDGGQATTASEKSGTAEVPEETAGPYPGDGSNGPNVLAESGVLRSDITSSFGGPSGTAAGVPTTIEMKLLDVAAGGKALAGAAVYIWHCDLQGRYSMYDAEIASENYLRGIQVSDEQGKVKFASIFPAAYSGPLAAHPLRGLREPRGGDCGGLEAADLPGRAAEGCLRRRLCDRRVRAERPEFQPNLARQRHGLQRRLRQPARGLVGLAKRRDRGQAQRRRLSLTGSGLPPF